MSVYRVDLAYDGSGFHGYARQPNVRTVQGELEPALFHLVGPVETSVAGRTDKGVHARGQVVSFETDREVDGRRMLRSLNRQLAPEISIGAIAPAADGFNARFSAVARSYQYVILNREAPDPFLASTSWHYPTPLDLGAMNAAARHVVGEHDFASFCRRAGDRSTVRRVFRAGWSDRGGGIISYDVTATSFCHQMVRSLVAVAVEVGRGRVDPDRLPTILEARDRAAAKGAAPPHGLTLIAVSY